MDSDIVPESRRRAKPQLSCNLCRAQKKRCDRENPCAACTARGVPCIYPNPNEGGLNADGPFSARRRSANVRTRLSKLENMVQTLQSAQDSQREHPVRLAPQLCLGCLREVSHDRKTPLDFAPRERSSSGNMLLLDSDNLDLDKTAYVSSTHWRPSANRLVEPSERSGAGSTKEFTQSSFATSSNDGGINNGLKLVREPPQLLFSHHAAYSKAQILQGLPSRDVADRQIVLYFNSIMIGRIASHSESFLEDYDKFWDAPMDAPIGWVALLFSVLCLASQVEYACAMARLDEPPGTTYRAEPLFLQETVQALILADYTNGGPYVMEALINYQMIEQTRIPDANVQTWILFGTILRIALRQGYHRDPSHFPNISVFQGEMRRRIFIPLHAMDVMLSLQLGLPRLLKDGHWDTHSPRDLLDEDLDRKTVELPPARPASEVTMLSHFIAKHRMFIVVGVIADTVMSVVRNHNRHSTLAAERTLGARLQDTYDSISSHVKLGSLAACLQHPATDILHRLSLDLLLYKGQIMLFWHHVVSNEDQMGVSSANGMEEGESESHHKHAYSTCVRAALKLLEFQSFVDSESRPDGALFIIRSQLMSSVPAHDFSMATIVVVANMYRLISAGDAASVEEREETEAVLRRSHSIWAKHCARSKDAAKVTGVLDALFHKLDSSSSRGFGNSANPSMLFDKGNMSFLEDFGLLFYLQDFQTFE